MALAVINLVASGTQDLINEKLCCCCLLFSQMALNAKSFKTLKRSLGSLVCVKAEGLEVWKEPPAALAVCDILHNKAQH